MFDCVFLVYSCRLLLKPTLERAEDFLRDLRDIFLSCTSLEVLESTVFLLKMLLLICKLVFRMHADIPDPKPTYIYFLKHKNERIWMPRRMHWIMR